LDRREVLGKKTKEGVAGEKGRKLSNSAKPAYSEPSGERERILHREREKDPQVLC